MPVSARSLVLVSLLGLSGSAGTTSTPRSLCDPDEPNALRPSVDLYCLELIPRPDVPAATGVVELGRAESAMDVAVTAEGNQRYDASIVLSGLPDPSSLGPYSTYVVWVAPPSLDPMVRMGIARNGRVHLGEISFDKFLVFVSAETSADVRDRQGRLVLRGMSPSIRMQQHSMVMTATSSDTAHDDHTAHGGVQTPNGPARWFMPPNRPSTPMMPMPGIDQLRPGATPFLPGAGVDPAALPEAVPQRITRLQNGDTLELTAGLVKRTLNKRPIVMYGYNGQYPGPLLQVEQGSTIHVRFRNQIDLPSAVHWHGVRLDNRSDGVPHVTQDPVAPGEQFQYVVKFPDAGIYWYHPHLREDIQQDLGLYGNILVRSQRPDAFGPAHREVNLIFDDLLLGDPGLVPFGLERATHALMGRFGNVLLVNGETRYDLAVSRGEVVRFYLTNVSNTRTFNVSLPGVRLKLVGADVGRYERESWVESVAIAPAQRYIVDVRFPEAGSVNLVNRVQAIDHNVGNFFAEVDTLGAVAVATRAMAPDLATEFERLRENRDVVTEIDAYRPWFSREPDRTLLLTLRLKDIPFALRQLLVRDRTYAHPVEWSGTMPMMDWITTSEQAEWVLRDPASGKENMAIDWRFKLGDVVKVRLANDRESLHPMSHPIHMHGQRFLVLAYNGVVNSNLVWKDTVLIPVGGTADLLIEMSNPGKWMMHCHVAEHLESGMMGVFEVTRGGADRR